jgi:hypothetical protein
MALPVDRQTVAGSERATTNQRNTDMNHYQIAVIVGDLPLYNQDDD